MSLFISERVGSTDLKNKVILVVPTDLLGKQWVMAGLEFEIRCQRTDIHNEHGRDFRFIWGGGSPIS